ncbi:hypothetical protein ACJMK2_026236 [Sinanodonta woodiana]|uniref:Uncharacterized protein n=1 Tax=Sinanodonta woodiana TaxID=1069815 RepID=A0ABD3XJ04_SINWO
MFETLIAAGLDVTARTNDSSHVLHIEASNYNLTIVKYLIDTNPGLLQLNDNEGWTALHHASQTGSVHMFETLIAAGLDVTARINSGAHVLHIAAINDNLTLVKYLIDTTPGFLQLNDRKGWTALHYASQTGSVHMFETLIAAGLDVTTRINSGVHVLHIAAGTDNLTLVKYLIDTNPGLLQLNDNNGWTVLHYASQTSSVDMFETLIAAGLDITARINSGAHVLHIAAGNDNLTLVKYLIDTNPGLLQLNDSKGWTALHYASQTGSVDTLETLIAAGLDITARNNNGSHVLHIAAANDNVTLVKYLIHANPGLLQQKDTKGWTVLHHASRRGRVDMFETLIAAGLDVTARTNDGAHVLPIAAINDNLTLVKYLIDTNPGLLQQDNKHGWTVLHHAAQCGSIPMLETLIAAGLDITARTDDGSHVLHIAAGDDNLTLVKYLIDTNPELLQLNDSNGWTALHHASQTGSVHMFKTLIAAGLDITARTNDGSHVLHTAAGDDNLTLVKYLIDTNPELLQLNDSNGWTALHHASQTGSVHMFETLIAAGLDITARTNNGYHVLHIAAGTDNLTLVKYLIDANPELLQLNDSKGWTMLHYASQTGSVDMFETLIAAGLDVTARTNSGAHVLHIAAGNDNLTLVKYLIDTNPGLLQLNDSKGRTALHYA